MLKKISIILITIILTIGMCSNVYAINDTITISKSVTSFVDDVDSGGDIVLEISDITIKENATYTFKLEYNELYTQLYDISNDDIKDNKITITLNRNKNDIAKILKITDEALLTIEETDGEETNIILDKHKIDVSLPLSKAFWVGHYSSGYHGIECVYNVDTIYYNYVLVQDTDILEKYLEYLKTYDSNSNQYWGYYVDNLIDTVNIEKNYPTSGWEKLTGDQTTTQPSIEGLYLIWMRAPKTDDNKEIVGCVFSKRFTDISVLEQQLTDSQEKQKELTATVSYNPSTSTTGNVTATIETNKKVNKVDGWNLSEDGKTLTKTYSKNTTEIVHLTDINGNTKDVEVKITNIEQQDNTIATGTLPQTGVSIAIAIGIIVVVIMAILAFIKYSSYKDIK